MNSRIEHVSDTDILAQYWARSALPAPLGQRLPVTYQAAQKLQQMILDGVWGEGVRLPAQRELSEKLGVSRASLREALSVLETRGLLSIEPGRGVFVRTANAQQPQANAGWRSVGRYTALEVFQVRFALNGLAAVFAATRSTDGEIQQLRQMTVAMDGALKRQDIPAFNEQDLAFHSLLIKCCGNHMILDMANIMQQEDYESTVLASKDHSGLALAIEEHQTIVDALVLRDSAKARSAIETHIRNAAVRAGIDRDLFFI